MNRTYPGDLPFNRFISEINNKNNKISNVATINHAEYAINNNPLKVNMINCNAAMMWYNTIIRYILISAVANILFD